jgi:phospholipid/cholesterol/gamma-HCH transport system substrate-binding protein
MGNQARNVMIGLFVIMACSLTIVLIMFLKPSVGDGKHTLYVRFSNINNINLNTRVLFAGKPVGEVVAIDEIYNARSQPTDALGSVYFYQLTLKIDSRVKVYNTDQIALQTSGLLGEKSIAILPKAPPQGVKPQLITDQPIYAESIDPIQNAFLEISQVANEIEGTFQRISQWIENHGDVLGKSVQEFSGALHETQILLSDVNRLQIMQDLKKGSVFFPRIMHNIDLSLQTLQQNHFFENLGQATFQVQELAGSLNTVVQNALQGSGTLGKLLTSEDLYLQVHALLNKGNLLLNNINHYGLLFHLNKQWQRLELQRKAPMQCLSNSQDLKEYVEKESDEMQAAAQKLTVFLEKEGGKPDWLYRRDFRTSLAELLRSTQHLSENLELFNQELWSEDRLFECPR